jgi:GAF domain-containing protein
MSNGRERQVSRAFVDLTDTLVSDYDPLEFMGTLAEHAVNLLDVSAAGVLLADERRVLSLAAASSEQAGLLEVFSIANDSGPCVDCLRDGQQVISPDLGADAERWPGFVAAAARAGFRSAHAVPMRLRTESIGVLNLLHTDPHTLPGDDSALAQALADAATIGLLHERAVRRAEVVTEQLQGALSSRVIVEQAKGALAQHYGISPADAFTALRSQARSTHTRLSDLALRIVERTVDPAEIPLPRPKSRP